MRKPKVIIFDDDPLILKTLSDILVLLDYEVETYSQPILCPTCNDKNLCSRPCADILITDFQMPNISGIELLRHQSNKKCLIDSRNKAIMSGLFVPKKKDGDDINDIAGSYFKKPISMFEMSDWVKDCKGRVDLSKPLKKYLDCN